MVKLPIVKALYHPIIFSPMVPLKERIILQNRTRSRVLIGQYDLHRPIKGTVHLEFWYDWKGSKGRCLVAEVSDGGRGRLDKYVLREGCGTLGARCSIYVYCRVYLLFLPAHH